MGKTLENPWREKMTRLKADSGERKVEPLSTCVAPTEEMYGEVPGKEGLKSPVEPLLEAPVTGLMYYPELLATPKSPED